MINDDCYKFLKLDIVSDTDNMISVYSLFEILDKYNLIDVYDEAVADCEDLSQEDLCNIMKAIIEKNIRTLK